MMHFAALFYLAARRLLLVALLGLLPPVPSVFGLTLELGDDPTTGQPLTITLPDDPAAALAELLGQTAGEASDAVDRLVMNASGCLKKADGTPITPAVVFLGKFGVPPSIVYGTTAVDGGVPPAVFTNIIGAGVIPAPVPVPLEPGCYWIPIPIDFLEGILALRDFPGMMADNSAELATANTGFSLFWILPIRPGYTFQPAAWEVNMKRNGSYRLRPIDDISQIDGIRNLPAMADQLLLQNK